MTRSHRSHPARIAVYVIVLLGADLLLTWLWRYPLIAAPITLATSASGIVLCRRSLRGREARLRREQARAIRLQENGRITPEEADAVQAVLDARFDALRVERDRRSRSARLRAWARTGVGPRPRLDLRNRSTSQEV